MRKNISLFTIGASAWAGIFFANTSAFASTIIDNSKPDRCESIVEEQGQRVGGTCDRFKLTRAGIGETEVEGFRVQFLFEGLSATHISVINDDVEVTETNGKTFTFYPAILQTIERSDDEPMATGTQGGICGIAVDYSGVVCNSLDVTYAHAGSPVSSSGDTDTAASSDPAIANSASIRQYTFNTNSHINTGVSVNPGDVVTVQASGTIRFGFFAGSGGPNGIIFNPDYNYFFDVPHGQLIGRVREFGMSEFDGWFPVAEGTEFVVRNQGVIEFAVNDNQPSDNVGTFQVEVTIESE